MKRLPRIARTTSDLDLARTRPGMRGAAEPRVASPTAIVALVVGVGLLLVALILASSRPAAPQVPMPTGSSPASPAQEGPGARPAAPA